jgi:hypothetical protein
MLQRHLAVLGKLHHEAGLPEPTKIRKAALIDHHLVNKNPDPHG